MALIKCPNCKQPISDKAKICPKCGISMLKNEEKYISIVENEENNLNDIETKLALYKAQLDEEYNKKTIIYKKQIDDQMNNYKRKIENDYANEKSEYEKQINEKYTHDLEKKVAEVKAKLETEYHKEEFEKNSKLNEMSKQLKDSKVQLDKQFEAYRIKYEAKRKIELTEEKKRIEKDIESQYSKKMDEEKNKFEIEKAELLKLIDDLTKKTEHAAMSVDDNKVSEKGSKNNRVIFLIGACVVLLIANIGQAVTRPNLRIHSNDAQVERSESSANDENKFVTQVSSAQENGDSKEIMNEQDKQNNDVQQNIQIPKDSVLNFGYVKETLFDDYKTAGLYKCGSDIEPGKYILLSTFGSVFYTVSNDSTKKDIVDSGNTAGKILELKEDTYIDIPLFAILVSKEKIDKDNLQKYGIFAVGKDIAAGEYKVKTLSDTYSINGGTYSNIFGYFEVYDDLLESSSNGCVDIQGNQEYVELKEGQYVILGNAALFPA